MSLGIALRVDVSRLCPISMIAIYKKARNNDRDFCKMYILDESSDSYEQEKQPWFENV